MLCTTKGIVLRTIRHTDNTLIAKIYTERFGLQSYLVRMSSSRKSGNKANLMQALSCLDLMVFRKETHGLQQLQDFSPDWVLQNIPFETLKSTIALFVAEMIYRSIKEEEENPQLYHFLRKEIKNLDEIKEDKTLGNFPLLFLLNFSHFLGFYPGNRHFPGAGFDLMDGLFIKSTGFGEFRLAEPLSEKLGWLIDASENAVHLKLNSLDRKTLLNALIDYYRIHLPGMGEVKSHEVLETVLHG